MAGLAARADAQPPTPVAATADDEIHMLCGHAHASMGRVALRSFLRWLPYEVAAYVHRDGSLTPEDEEAWRRSFPGVNIVHRADVQGPLDAFFADGGRPNLHNFSRHHLYAPKLINFHLMGSGRRVVMLDTDVLFFRRPDELIGVRDEMARSGRRIYTTFDDIQDSYVAPTERAVAVIGPIAPRFNAGMALVPKLGEEEYRLVEEMLGKMLAAFPEAIRQCYSEQTTYAALAARHETHRLAPDYSVGGVVPGVTSAHFAGPFRELYFSEGLPLLA